MSCPGVVKACSCEGAVETGVGCCGKIGFVVFGLTLVATVLAYLPVVGVTDAPDYARSMLYASVAHHFTDVDAYLDHLAPSPPVWV